MHRDEAKGPTHDAVAGPSNGGGNQDDANVKRGVGAQATAAQVRCTGAVSAQVFELFVLVQSEEGSDVLAGYFRKAV